MGSLSRKKALTPIRTTVIRAFLAALPLCALILLTSCGIFDRVLGNRSEGGDSRPTDEPVPGLVTYVPRATEEAAPIVPAGQELYVKTCSACHGMPPRHNLVSSGHEATKEIISKGIGRMEGLGSAGSRPGLSTNEIESIVGFLKSSPVRTPAGPFYPHLTPTEGCSSCHNSQQLGPPPQPLHTGLADETCAGCHFPALRQAFEIPHAADSTPPCSDCHGPTGVAPAPADHENRSQPMCAFCHSGWKAAPYAPHSAAWRDCASCHQPESAVRPPMSHRSALWNDCQNSVCHRPLEY